MSDIQGESVTSVTSVIDVHKKNLKKLGYEDFEDWISDPNHVYIGRNMAFYVKGTFKSKWANPFSVKKYGREGAIDKYREYILENQNLYSQIEELRGKVLGCWCSPEPCHGDVLIEILN